jgi:hypothetical protein
MGSLNPSLKAADGICGRNEPSDQDEMEGSIDNL